MAEVLTIERFCAVIAEYFELDAADVQPASRLLEDLLLDSLQLLEVTEMLIDLGGGSVPDEALDDLVDVSDVYHYYRQGRTS